MVLIRLFRFDLRLKSSWYLSVPYPAAAPAPRTFRGRAGEGEGCAAGLAERDDAPPVEVEQLVQFHQVSGDVDERRGDYAPVHQVQHRQQQEWLVRGLALGGVGRLGRGRG